MYVDVARLDGHTGVRKDAMLLGGDKLVLAVFKRKRKEIGGMSTLRMKEGRDGLIASCGADLVHNPN